MPTRGTTLGARLIATTTVLSLSIVLLFGGVELWQQGRIFDVQSVRLGDLQLMAIERRGIVQTRDLVESSRSAILQSDYATLQAFLPRLAPAGERDVAWALVADKDGQVLAHSDAAQNGQRVADAAALELLSSGETASRRVEAGGRRLMLFAHAVHAPGDGGGAGAPGARLGGVVIAFDLAGLDEQLAWIARDKEEAAREATLRTAVIGLVCVLLGAALAVLQSLRITRPVSLLAWRADQIARGDLDGRVELTGGDELERLGASFNHMADQLAVLLRETAEKAVLEKELEVARAIQETLVPPADVVRAGGVEVAGHFAPSSQCGGDWWTVLAHSDGRVLVAIGDVTGHGVPAAMITACAKAAADTLHDQLGARLGPALLLEGLNRVVLQSARRRFHMTCFAALLDARAGEITYANAGHNFPYVLRGAGEAAELQVLAAARGNRLGDVEASRFEEHRAELSPGDLLVLFTDGVTELERPGGEAFGDKRLRSLLRQSGGDVTAVRAAIVGALDAFAAGQPAGDDVTLVLARRA